MSASAREVLGDWILDRDIQLRAGESVNKQADQIIAALSASGFVVVPREPTEEMMDAAYQAQINEANYEPWPTDPSGAEYVSEWVCARIAYRAMLSAAEGKK